MPDEGLLHRVVAEAPIVVFAIDRAGVLTLIEGEGLQRLGARPEDLIGREVLSVCENVSGIEEDLFRALGGESGSSQLDVGAMTFEVWHAPLYGEKHEVVGVAGVAMDVTDRERAGERLRAGRQWTEQMLQSHERDRRLIAYEIHDGLVQDIVGAQMELDALVEDPALPPAVRRQVQQAADLVRKSVAQGRELIGGLRPPVLDALGVVAAIKYLVESQPADGPAIRFVARVQCDRLAPLLETTIYRIVQEAITNVRRHSQSDRADIRLTQVGDWFCIEIEDWGIGFDPGSVSVDRFGLQGIRERARLLRGRAVISSTPGKGTRVLVDLPVVPALEEASAGSWSKE